MSAYNEELTAKLAEKDVWTYTEALAFAEEHGLKPRSVIAKVKSMDLTYVPKPVRVTKRGEPVVKKQQLVAAIEAALSIKANSLMKVAKSDLETLVKAVPGAVMPKPE